MNLIKLFEKYPTHKSALEHLEKVRWGNKPICPYCGSDSVTKFKNELRYHCNKENKSFSVRVGTIFEDSRLDIRKWFYAIMLMLNAKKGISAMQLSRDLSITYKTAWYCAMRIRCAMADQGHFLHGVVEADVGFIGGKPLKDVKGKTINPATSSGFGTKKMKIVGAVERRKHGKVIAEAIPDQTSATLMKVLKKYISGERTTVITDAAYNFRWMDEEYNHKIIKHSERFAKDKISINKIEGFFTLLKRGHMGQYHQLSEKYLPFYLAEFTYRYNQRLNKNDFEDMIELAVENEKCMIRYKCNVKKGVKICDI